MRTGFAILPLLAALLLQPGRADACSCVYGGPFSKVGPQGDLVVVADVVSHYSNSMQVDVVQVLKGEEGRRRLTVWGDNGMQCRPYVSYFPEKTRWVISMFRHPDEEAGKDLRNLRDPLPESDAKPPYYVLSACGGYWLEIRGENAHGAVNQGYEVKEMVPVPQLIRWFEGGAKGELSPVSPSDAKE